MSIQQLFQISFDIGFTGPLHFFGTLHLQGLDVQDSSASTLHFCLYLKCCSKSNNTDATKLQRPSIPAGHLQCAFKTPPMDVMARKQVYILSLFIDGRT